MRYVFTSRVRICVLHLFFLLAGVSVAPLASAEIDPVDTYCSNYMYGLSVNNFEVSYTISLDNYNSGWTPPAYNYANVGSYRCELIFKMISVASVYEDTGTVDLNINYALTGRKWRGSNPWYSSNNSQDSSLNPSNSYMDFNGNFNRGMHCTEGQHIYSPFPKGYRYVPFDGFKYFSTDSWSACLFDVAWYVLQQNDYSLDGSIYSAEIRYYNWDSNRFSSDNKFCTKLSDDCLYVVMYVQKVSYYSEGSESEIYGFYESFYARCPPNSQFSPVHGACYVLEVDELLAGTDIGDSDLYAQPGGGDKVNVNFNSVNLLNQISKPGINQCPSPLKTTFRGQVITFFDYTDSCQILDTYVKPFVLLGLKNQVQHFYRTC